jgi:hypothetical protein
MAAAGDGERNSPAVRFRARLARRRQFFGAFFSYSIG